MGTTVVPEQIDPATADLARRLQNALPHHRISDDEAIRAAREIDGVYPHTLTSARE